MGEKYDSYCDDGPLYHDRLQIPLARVASPVGPGFPPDELSQMLAGGQAGLERVARYADRASNTIERVASEASDALRNAGADPGATLAAGQQVVAQLNGGLGEVRQQIAQSNVTFQMLDDAGTYEPNELAAVARDSARKATSAVSASLGPLDELINTVLTSVQDQALAAIGNQAEAAVARIGQFVHTSAAGLYNALLRRGMGEPPEGTGSAA
jgi:ABC-type transporter Mla subunit MlaD